MKNEGQPGATPEPPEVMSPEQLAYRKRIQEAVLEISQLVLAERREEIIARARKRLEITDGLKK